MSPKNNGNGGAIGNVSSVAALDVAPFEYIDYAASKGAIDSMTVGLARNCTGKNPCQCWYNLYEIHARGGEPGRVEPVKEMISMKRGAYPE